MIGWYVHHQGAGHLARLEAVAAHLRTPVVGLSTLPAPPGWEDRWVRLARDDDPTPGTGDDVDAHGVLHWAPTHHGGLADRMGAVAAWIARGRPRLVVVDVSVEVALFARLCGVPVVVVALPGVRTDRAHRAAHELAVALLGPWPEGAHGGDWPPPWRAKTWAVGGLSRFDAMARPTAPDGSRRRTVLVVWGAGGRDTGDEAVEAARDATPGWRWVERSPDRPSPDLWADLCAADVVVTHAGQNAVADVAAARAPAVVIAQRRPFEEQDATVHAVNRLDVAEGRTSWPAPHEWPALLEAATRRGGDGWSRWSTGRGARDAAARIDALVEQDQELTA